MLDLDGRPSLTHFGDARGVEHQLLRLRGEIGHERVMGVRISGASAARSVATSTEFTRSIDDRRAVVRGLRDRTPDPRSAAAAPINLVRRPHSQALLPQLVCE